MSTDIIIVGAGASGLMAAQELSRHHRSVQVLEARNRIGGRIHTQQLPAFGQPVESGAEFIHGRLPLTISLLKQYNIPFEAIGGDFIQVEKGRFKTEQDFIEHSRKLEKIFSRLDTDMSVKDLLDKYAPDDAMLRQSVQRFVEGYDAADISRASALAFKEEWLGDDDEQYRITGGYMPLVEAMAETCRQRGVKISLSSVVKEVRWSASQANVLTADGKMYQARQVLVTVPLGVLQCTPEEDAFIAFVPPLPEKEKALEALGYGTVIKFVLQFSEAFWKTASFKAHTKQDLEGLGFLLSDAEVPTWWTQAPAKEAILTGWLAGPRAKKHAHDNENDLLELALGSLAAIFLVEPKWFRSRLVTFHVANWTAEPFSKGAYSYATAHSEEALHTLLRPVAHTLFFAGEVFGQGASKSTVEAALSSGIEAAGTMLKQDE